MFRAIRKSKNIVWQMLIGIPNQLGQLGQLICYSRNAIPVFHQSPRIPDQLYSIALPILCSVFGKPPNRNSHAIHDYSSSYVCQTTPQFFCKSFCGNSGIDRIVYHFLTKDQSASSRWLVDGLVLVLVQISSKLQCQAYIASKNRSFSTLGHASTGSSHGCMFFFFVGMWMHVTKLPNFQ